MKKIILGLVLSLGLLAINSYACTNILITRGASTDGSTMISYAADSHTLYGSLYKYNAPLRAPATLQINEWDTGKYLGVISNPEITYSTVGNVNEHQLMISETTYGGRKELYDSTGIMDYGSLIYVTLQRAKTARAAIDTIVNLANRYGYASSGESFSIADPNEVWIFEMIGKGCKIVDGVNVNSGIVWVARRIPDGYISAHANQARIHTFPLNDPENTIYAPDVISFAREAGYFKGKDKDFSFCDAYAPLDFGAMRFCEARAWSVFNMFSEGMDKYEDFAMGHNPENKMPLWVKPTKKVSPKEVFDGMRDHYEGTMLDMTTDIGAGGSESPYRWRPMTFSVDGETYVNERAIATQQSGFWFVSQARNWLPDPIGCILWFGVDDAATSCLTPIYCSTTKVPESLRTGNGHMTEYSSTASFWVFNRIAQFAYLRYDIIGKAVQQVANQWENQKLNEVKIVDKIATELYAKSPEEAVQYLTDYTVSTAQQLFDKWVELDKYLMVKYIDGNIKKEDINGFIQNGNNNDIPASPEQFEYSEKWKRAVVKDAGDKLRVIK